MEKTANKNDLPILTAEAKTQVSNILKDEPKTSFIRLLVDSGGCSGFSYKFSVDNDFKKENDVIISKNDSKYLLVSDIVSLDFLKNSTINWAVSLTGSQFVIDNPVARSSCGCGSSFSI
tara:strand:- start:94 stop:450 length:357 start_codon:yes stop_codon:yes gene_type:complete